MKKVSVTYNPYLVRTKILVDNKQPVANSGLDYTDAEMRLTEWADDFPIRLMNAYGDSNFDLEFTGLASDYEILKSSFEKQSKLINFHCKHVKVMDDVAEVEKKIREIFEAIQNGPVAALKDVSIKNAFHLAEEKKITVAIVAAMNAGKSTLINALLHKKLMPVAHKATTATIVRIEDTNQSDSSAIAYNSDGDVITTYNNVTYAQMKEMNENDKIHEIHINGRIPCVSSVGMKLEIIDTPGPNSYKNLNHRIKTGSLLQSSDTNPNLVLFVLNAENLDTNDENNILDLACESMKKHNKHGRDRYFFIVNKIDRLDLEDDSVNETLTDALNELSRKGVVNPNIFPLAAQVAYELRVNTMTANDLNNFKDKCKDESMHLENYYQFSHLSSDIRTKLDDRLKTNPSQSIEIHSGIISVEEAIKQYVDLYARPIKIHDLVNSFNGKLTELAVIDTLEESIKDNEQKRHELIQQIKTIESNIESGKKALEFSESIDDLSFFPEYNEKVREMFATAMSNIMKIEVSEREEEIETAKKECKKLTDGIDGITAQLIVQVDDYINCCIQESQKVVNKQFIQYVESMSAGIPLPLFSIDKFCMDFNNFISLERAFKNHTKMVEESYVVTKREQVKVEGNRMKKAQQNASKGWRIGAGGGWIFMGPIGGALGALLSGAAAAAWGYMEGKGDHLEEKVTSETKYRNVEKVKMDSLLKETIQEINKRLECAKCEVLYHIKNQQERIKESVKGQIEVINNALVSKLNDLKTIASDIEITSHEIYKKEEQKAFVSMIKAEVDKLIDF